MHECSECGRQFTPESGEKPVRCDACGAPAYRQVTRVYVPRLRFPESGAPLWARAGRKRRAFSAAAGLALIVTLAGCEGGPRPRHYWTAEHKAICREYRQRSRCVRVFGRMEARVQAAEDDAASAGVASGVALGLAAGSAGRR